MSATSASTAARNDAAWCDAVCSAAGGQTDFTNGIWRNSVRSPPYFPNIITVDPAAEVDAVEEAVRMLSPRGSEVGIKDSFCKLDLGPSGYAKLFQASWIAREPVRSPRIFTQLTWTKIDSFTALRAWEREWWPEGVSSMPTPAIFGRALLERNDICFLAGHEGTTLMAGAAITETEHVAGLTCTFFRGRDTARLRRELLLVLESRYPDQVVLGYESGDELVAMKGLGFIEVGPLRVWLSTGSC